jgi:mannitol operon repressor
MVKSPPKLLKQLSRSLIGPKEIADFIEEIREESDRSAAIILAAFVEQTLEQTILSLLSSEKKWRKRVERAKFEDKNKIALKLSLVDQLEFDNLEIIRKIRNAFAHAAIRLRFETPEVAAEVDALHDAEKGLPAGMPGALSKRRLKYTSCCIASVMTVRFRGLGKRLELISRVTSALVPHLGKQFEPHAQAIEKAVPVLKKFKL